MNRLNLINFAFKMVIKLKVNDNRVNTEIGIS